jgi:hypothetical protein
MFSISLSVGPCVVDIQTDERLSFDGIETLLNRSSVSVLTLFNAHLGALVKYDNYDNDHECDECAEINNELD